MLNDDKLITYHRLMQADPDNVIRLAKSLYLPIEGTHEEICIRIMDDNRSAFPAKERQEMIAYWEGMAMSTAFIEKATKELDEKLAIELAEANGKP
jgi:hypothetical protein